MQLAVPPNTITTFNEIAVRYDADLPSAYNNLEPAERIVAYYLLRASLPGNRIFTDQVHRDGIAITDFFEQLVSKLAQLADRSTPLPTIFDTISFDALYHDAHCFLVYLWTNHGQYFQREHGNEKRTPQRLGLTTLTPDTIIIVAQAVGIADAQAFVTQHLAVIFDASYEASTTEADSIIGSAVNIYSADFTDADYNTLSAPERNAINNYFYIDTNDDHRTPKTQRYAVGQRYDQELRIATYWLSKAHKTALDHPELFDLYFTTSLDLLIQFLTTGDENIFKKHCVAWLKSSSRLDYNFGFIETYQDPKGMRGMFQAEATIKIIDIQQLNALLPSFEQQLPFPDAFKRKGLDDGTATIPNASINRKIFGAGGLGPLFITAAYCLPNYEEIRSEYGSKQIIYPSDTSIEQLLNPDLARRLFNLEQRATWLAQNDPHNTLGRDIWDAQCILHETIGHASGNLAQHRVTDPNGMTVQGVTYNYNDSIPLTNAVISELLSGYESTLEELRAEIIALYISITHLDALQNVGILSRWKGILTSDELKQELIIGMASTGLRRLIQQSDTTNEITGDHARANYTIMNYLIDNGGLNLVEEIAIINNTSYTVIGLTIRDFAKVQDLITQLMVLVQTIKSTGDRNALEQLIKTYGITIRYPEHMKILQANKRAVVGAIKVSCYLQPLMTPLFDDYNNIIDIAASWPQSIDELEKWYKKAELSTDSL